MSNESENRKPQLHVSMLDMFARCGIAGQRRFGHLFGIWHECEIVPPGVALITGTATHKAVEHDLRHLLQHGTLASLEELHDVARDAVYDRVETEGLTVTDDEAEDVEKAIGGAMDMAVQLSTLHHTEVAPSLRPISIEQPFVIEMPGFPIDLAGQKDIVEVGRIRDTKTSKTAPALHEARTMQTAMYSLSYEREHGQWPDEVSLDYLVKTKTPKYVQIASRPDETWVAPLFRRIERFIETIDAVKAGHQALTPADPTSWQCTARYCGYAKTCPFWSGREK